MRAIYNPKDMSNMMSFLERYQGNEFNFKFAYELHGVKYYSPDDINFLGSNPIAESDLEFIDEISQD